MDIAACIAYILQNYCGLSQYNVTLGVNSDLIPLHCAINGLGAEYTLIEETVWLFRHIVANVSFAVLVSLQEN